MNDFTTGLALGVGVGCVSWLVANVTADAAHRVVVTRVLSVVGGCLALLAWAAVSL